jgi:hypothetical protein
MSKQPMFSKDDLALLRRPALACAVAAGVSAAMFFGIGYMSSSANAAYARAQSQYQQVQSSIQQIATEESTIVRYLGRFREMQADGVFEEEDRLRLLERVQDLRSRMRLFPISVEVGEQGNQILTYPPEELLPGDPVALQFSRARLEFAAVHESDFANVIEELLSAPGLFQPVSCQLLASGAAEDFSELGENLDVDCELDWYTFNLSPPEVPIVN